GGGPLLHLRRLKAYAQGGIRVDLRHHPNSLPCQPGGAKRRAGASHRPASSKGVSSGSPDDSQFEPELSGNSDERTLATCSRNSGTSAVAVSQTIGQSRPKYS